MSVQPDLARLSLGEFLERIRSEMVPLSNQFSYFSAAPPLNEEDTRDYLEDPIAALPPAVCSLLPKVSLLLVPFLERSNGRDKRDGRMEDFVAFEAPPEGRWLHAAQWLDAGVAVLAFGTQDVELADYHYEFYHQIAVLAGLLLPEDRMTSYYGQLREELEAHVHGEVDDRSWQLKQGLLRRQNAVKRDSKKFREYARESLVDTLTLYLHGICCDIDVETGPRQLPSRHLRRRLKLIHEMFPPPTGYAVFPEELDSEPVSG